MIEHNLTLAWRQLVKYRLQSAVSKLRETLELVTYDGFNVFRCLNQQPISEEQLQEQMRSFFLP